MGTRWNFPQHLCRNGRSQYLLDAYWLPASSPAFKYTNPNGRRSLSVCAVFVLQTFVSCLLSLCLCNKQFTSQDGAVKTINFTNLFILVCVCMSVDACKCGFCNVWVFWQLCGCFGNMCTFIYCFCIVLWCFSIVSFMYIYSYLLLV